MYLRDWSEDEKIYRDVYLGNEYQLPEKFTPEDVIIDVGAHVGCFALACLRRGAHRIACFEPDTENYQILRVNMHAYRALIQTNWRAIWRSDRHEQVLLATPQGCHPGGLNSAYRANLTVGVEVPSCSLDSILAQFDRVRLLKIDCEGSEYPILYTSKELGRVQEIVGEAHRMKNIEDLDRPQTTEGLAAFLEDQGFAVEHAPHPGCPQLLSLFRARRKWLKP